MKAFIYLILCLSISIKSFGLRVPSPWTITDITVADCKKLGIEFEFDNQSYEQHPLVEISILLPHELTFSGHKVQFYSVCFWSKECAVALAVHPYKEKKRAILSINRRVLDEAKIAFYYTIENKDVVSGVRYDLPTKDLLQGWGKKKEANKQPEPTRMDDCPAN